MPAERSLPPHIIISAIEHSSVYSCAEYLKKDNVEVTILPVDSNGLVSIKQLEESLKENTVLVSIMYANNETGVIQPIKEIGEMLKLHNQVSFHVDGVQAVGKMEIALGSIDLFTFSGHKIGGPKGIGALIVKSNTVIAPIIWEEAKNMELDPEQKMSRQSQALPMPWKFVYWSSFLEPDIYKIYITIFITKSEAFPSLKLIVLGVICAHPIS